MIEPTSPARPRALSFDTAAARYDSARPGYPPALFDAIEEITGRSLHGMRVIDVGAGTGIATRLLRARGARVTAVEPGPGMAAQLRRTLPDTPLVLGSGDALPLADGSADLITYAQSWHWTNPARSLPEALRVLRPGGALALWWNVADLTVPWIAAQAARMSTEFTDGAYGAPGDSRRLPDPVPTQERAVSWTRELSVDAHLDNLSSHSLFLTMRQDEAARFLARERAELLKAFPDGVLHEEYEVQLTVTFRPERPSHA
ncbi:class I SAM-dependent methyltransferase [Streptomyces sp. NPDC056500]|uniref:class I SAM-dependent methyltransferase n=1 Tax=Streptomyces sp. NPDC056500 TaxID=3345840 RepID=UPI0036C84DA6